MTKTLADKLHEFTFNPDCAALVDDPHALRTTLRHAHRFRVDDAGSALLADLSHGLLYRADGAIDQDYLPQRMRGLREAGRPPYRATWIESDPRPRMRRTEQLSPGTIDGGGPDEYSAHVSGWLVEQHRWQPEWYRMSIASGVDYSDDVEFTSWAFAWCRDTPATQCPWPMIKVLQQRDAGDLDPRKILDAAASSTDRAATLALGVGGYDDPGVRLVGGYGLSALSQMSGTNVVKEWTQTHRADLRYVLIFLSTIASLPRVETEVAGTGRAHRAADGSTTTEPLAHRVVHLDLPARRSPAQAMRRAIGEAMWHKREHDVRGHWRTYRDEAGGTRMRVWVDEHKRGDIRLGRVEKTYETRRAVKEDAS